MRVLACCTPMEGVFAPMVPLMTALCRDGHDVLVATGPDLVDRVREVGLTAVAVGPAAEEAAALAVRDPEFATGGQRWRLGATMFARVLAPQRLPALRRLVDDLAPDLVVQAPVDLAAPLAAAGRGIPRSPTGPAWCWNRRSCRPWPTGCGRCGSRPGWRPTPTPG